MPFGKSDTQKAIDFCKHIRHNDPNGRQLSNRGGWQSQDMFFKDIVNTPLEIYFNTIKTYVENAFSDLQVYTSKIELGNVWININANGNYNIVHVHPGSVLSGCFYLTANNSSIVLKRPVDAFFAYLFIESKRVPPNVLKLCASSIITREPDGFVAFPDSIALVIP